MDAYAQTSRLLALPNETITMIAEFIVPEDPELGSFAFHDVKKDRYSGVGTTFIDQYQDRSDRLRGLAATCKHLREIARPISYRVICIDDLQSIVYLLRTFIESPELPPNVLSLSSFVDLFCPFYGVATDRWNADAPSPARLLLDDMWRASIGSAKFPPKRPKQPQRLLTSKALKLAGMRQEFDFSEFSDYVPNVLNLAQKALGAILCLLPNLERLFISDDLGFDPILQRIVLKGLQRHKDPVLQRLRTFKTQDNSRLRSKAFSLRRSGTCVLQRALPLLPRLDTFHIARAADICRKVDALDIAQVQHLKVVCCSGARGDEINHTIGHFFACNILPNLQTLEVVLSMSEEGVSKQQVHDELLSKCAATLQELSIAWSAPAGPDIFPSVGQLGPLTRFENLRSLRIEMHDLFGIREDFTAEKPSILHITKLLPASLETLHLLDCWYDPRKWLYDEVFAPNFGLLPGYVATNYNERDSVGNLNYWIAVLRLVLEDLQDNMTICLPRLNTLKFTPSIHSTRVSLFDEEMEEWEYRFAGLGVDFETVEVGCVVGYNKIDTFDPSGRRRKYVTVDLFPGDKPWITSEWKPRSVSIVCAQLGRKIRLRYGGSSRKHTAR